MTSQKDEGTSLTANLEMGDLTQALMRLKEWGIVPEQFAAIGKQGNWDLYGLIADILTTYSMFISARDQVNLLAEINKAVWKDPELSDDILSIDSRCAPTPSRSLPMMSAKGGGWYVDSGLYCVTLVYETGDPIETLCRNWAAVHYAFKKIFGENLVGEATPGSVNTNPGTRFSWDEIPRDQIKLPKGIDPRPKGFYWVEVELGRCQKLLDKSVIGADLLMVAAMHPAWLLKSSLNRELGTDKQQFPLVVARGIEIHDREACQRMTPYPYLHKWDLESDRRNGKPLYLLGIDLIEKGNSHHDIHNGLLINSSVAVVGH